MHFPRDTTISGKLHLARNEFNPTRQLAYQCALRSSVWISKNHGADRRPQEEKAAWGGTMSQSH
jgi:hypothetical protein